MTVLLLGLSAGVGAVVRYLATRLADKLKLSGFPWATFAVNVIGSFLIGFFFAQHLNSVSYKILATGFCGGLTTFSTFNFELIDMLDKKKYAAFARYFVLSYGVGFAACLLGLFIGK